MSAAAVMIVASRAQCFRPRVRSKAHPASWAASVILIFQRASTSRTIASEGVSGFYVGLRAAADD